MKTTVAALRRSLTPGTRVRITNHFRPAASRDTVVHEKTNTVSLVTWAHSTMTGEEVASHLSWPKASHLRGDDRPGVFHVDTPDGDPFLTLEVIGDDHPEAGDWPATVRDH